MPLNITPQYALKTAALLGLMGWAMPSWAYLTVECEVLSAPTINFGVVNVLDNELKTASAGSSVRCHKGPGGVIGNAGSVCLKIGTGTGSAGAGSPHSGNLYGPRLMKAGATNFLGFQIYKNSAYSDFWGTNNPGVPFKHTFTGFSTSWQTKTFDYFMKIQPTIGSSDIRTIPPGNYATDFTGNHTEWRSTNSASPNDQCNNGAYIDSGTFALYVRATVNPECRINGKPNDINFGSHLGGQSSNLAQSTDLKVQCTNTTPYNIALTPSNSNTTGAGLMKKAGDPSQTVPYQLRQATGMSGAVWGNAGVSASNTGNGVGGTGSGYEVTHKIYATVANTNYAPGDYEDTVTVTVHY